MTWYCAGIETALEHMGEGNYQQVLELAKLPEEIRGYEDIKEKSALQQQQKAQQLLGEICR